jgi:IS4 transposase
MLNPIFDRFAKKSPISVIARGMAERVLNPKKIDKWFDRTAQGQYTKDLLFSSLFDIMSQVVCGSRPSVNAAYQASKEGIGVSVTSLYNKLNGIEIHTSAELVRYAAGQVEPIIKKLGGISAAPLPGLRVKLLDGNCIEKTEHRIKELRELAAGPLPGKSLVVYDPVLRLPIDVFPCENGHSQERSLLSDVLLTIKAGDVWVADRNFCTVGFTCGINARDAFFIIREHKKYPWQPLEKERYIGKTDTGKVYEQPILVTDKAGDTLELRRIRVSLNNLTRDGDRDIFIIANLPEKHANAIKIAELYRDRWTIETAFQELTEYLNSEIKTLGYPRAALFGFCVALVSYMILSVIKAALGSVHGTETVKNKVSGYYVADEISGTYRGMMIAIPDEEWCIFQQMSIAQLLKLLKQLSKNVNMSAFLKHPRGPKKPAPKRKSSKKSPHVSTAVLIAQRKS